MVEHDTLALISLLVGQGVCVNALFLHYIIISDSLQAYRLQLNLKRTYPEGYLTMGLFSEKENRAVWSNRIPNYLQLESKLKNTTRTFIASQKQREF